MSHTPRQVALLAQLFAPDPAARTAAVLAHVADPVAAASAGLGPFVREKLNDPDPAARLTAADYLWRVSGDPAPAVAELCDRFRRGDAPEALDAMLLLGLLGQHAAEPLVALARGLPAVFGQQSDDFVMWAARTVLCAGPHGGPWFQSLLEECPGVAPLLLTEFANTAPRLEYDAEHVAGAVRPCLERPPSVHTAGAALWRLTWRVHRPWLDALARDATPLDGLAELLAVTTRVLTEHLGRRPDVAPTVRMYLVRLAAAWQSAGLDAVPRLARLGGRGWGVLLLVLQESPPGDPVKVPDALRAAVLSHAARLPAVLPLVHHHAHRFLLDRWEKRENRGDELVTAAAEVLAAVGPAAGFALPDILKLLGREVALGPVLCAAAKAVAPGHPLALSATVRALAAVRAQGAEARAVFGFLAGVLFHLDPDAGPGLVSQTAVPDAVVAQVLASGCWRDAPADVRAKHAAALADLLGSPRADVRLRAAAALKHYLPELPGVWPAVVAALAAADDEPAAVLLTYARLLGPVADAAAAELHALFDDPNPAYAARAGVALWRLGRWREIAPRLRARDEVARGMAELARTAHGLQDDIAELFAGIPLGRRARTLPDTFMSLLDPLVAAAKPPDAARWAGIAAAMEREPKPLPALFALAVMSGFGTGEFTNQKIWMIKHHREMTRAGLAGSKRAVEHVMDLLAGDRPRAARAAAVREFYPHSCDIPEEVVALIDNPDAACRWVGLELADAWGLSPQQVLLWVEERRRDSSPLVRGRAARVGP